MSSLPVSGFSLHALLFSAACLLAVADAAASTTEEEVRITFDKFVQVQNAHDANALAGLLADSPHFLWITRGMPIWGRDAALQRFSKLYEGTWRLDPELGSLRIMRVTDGVAQLHVPVRFTTGAPGQQPQVTRVYLNQVLVRSGGAWRVMSIFPVPAPAP